MAGKTPKTSPKVAKKTAAVAKVALLAGNNPRMAKADADAPVQGYVEAMPDWGKS